jgi:hypothetical protein
VTAPGFTLRLLQVPPTLLLDLLAAIDGLQREVQVTALDEDGPTPVAQATHDALVEGREQIETARNAILDQAVAARDAGLARADLSARYATTDLAPIRAARAGVAAADAAAARGELLSTPLGPEERRLWDWIGVQVETQATGGEPTPFPAASTE